ncbi:hypothetical protein SAMN04487943_101133 [Gracilibacillus orientalis]|uniref:Uncharacterized protein n=1 Tax=Gracilibacillus orientalis TaxID=334253 RepID=A0A1I4H2C1_9BACI|nr:hypothetical protein [Gracilibacillus orientalis]SFL35566.1 hypothetical protein SAMN04487943_101133 [Gracilibacillus orientalis]
MIATMYKRRERLAVLLLGIIFLVTATYLIIDTPTTTNEWLEAGSLLLPFSFLIIVAVMSRYKYQKVKEVDIPLSERTIEDIDHVVVKKDATFITQLLVFEQTGCFMGTYRLTSLSWWHYPIVIFMSSFLMFLPFNVSYFSHQGEKLFSFKRRGIKKTVLDVYDQNDNFIGQYEQEDFKSLVKIKGKLLDRNSQLILPVKASASTGDFDIRDKAGHRWAYFYDGRFPHEYTEVFNEIDNDIVEMSDYISREKKILLLAMIGHMFLVRSK